MKRALSYFWKLLLCSFGFFVGITLNSIALDVLGYQAVKISNVAYTNTILVWFFMGSMLLAFFMSFVSRSLKINWLWRWIILLESFWLLGIGGVSSILSLSVSMSTIASLMLSLVVMSNFILPGLLLSGLVTVLFQPAKQKETLPKSQVFSSQAIFSMDI